MRCTIGSDCDCSGRYHFPPEDFSILNTSKRKRCVSCEALIDIGSYVGKLTVFREPLSYIEEQICGDEVPLADRYYCEKCAEIYFNLTDLGFDVCETDMREALRIYLEEYKKEE